MSLAPQEGASVYDVERTYLSRFSHGPLWLRVLADDGSRAAAEAGVTLTLVNESTGEEHVYNATEESRDGGLDYRVALSPTHTAEPGPYTARWSYQVNGEERIGEQGLLVGPSAPTYDALSPELKDIVDGVWLRLSDLYDSPTGGPHLQVYIQTHFGRNKIAGLLRHAIGRLNTVAQPHQTYDAATFPIAKWGALLETALYVETLKHLRRSYIEQPQVVGTQVARLDRSAYAREWAAILAEEERDLRSMLDHFKIASMNLGSGRALVAGGIFPRISSGAAGLAARGAPRGIYYGRA